MKALRQFLGDTFSKRQNGISDGSNDVFQYDAIPRKIRVQIVQIWLSVLGDSSERPKNLNPIEEIVTYLRREIGEFRLPSEATNSNLGAPIDHELMSVCQKTQDELIKVYNIIHYQ